MTKAYEVRPPQPITVIIETSDGGRLAVEATLDRVSASGGGMAMELVLVAAKVKPINGRSSDEPP